jgi:hypothetical protein
MVPIKNGRDSQLAIQLSQALATSIEKAMRHGRRFWSARRGLRQSYERFKIDEQQGTDNIAKLEREMAELSKKKQLDNNDEANLKKMWFQLQTELGMLRQIQDGREIVAMQKTCIQNDWIKSWLDIENRMEEIWRNAGIPLEDAQQPKPRASNSNPIRQDQHIRQRDTDQDFTDMANVENYFALLNQGRRDQPQRMTKATDWKANKWHNPFGNYSTSKARLVEVSDGGCIVPALLLSRELAEDIEKAIRVDRKYDTLLSRTGDSKKRLINPEEWQHRLSNLVHMLDDIWVTAEIVQPYRYVANSNEQLGVPGTKGANGHPHGHTFSALARLSKCQKDLIKARDRCDDYCHNYDREAARYLEQMQKTESRSPTEIRKGFSKIFIERAKLRKKEVRAAREHYLAAEDQALNAGIPQDCLDFVEPIDIYSCDSSETEEIHEERYISERRVAGRDQNRKRDRVIAWLSSGSMEPVSPQRSIIESIPDQSGSAASIAHSHGSRELNVPDDKSLAKDNVVERDVDEPLHASDVPSQGQPFETDTPGGTQAREHQRLRTRSQSPVAEKARHSMTRDPKQKSGMDVRANSVSDDGEGKGPDVNLWDPAHGIKFAAPEVIAPDPDDDNNMSGAIPVVGVSPGPKKRSIAEFFKPRPHAPASSSRAVVPRKGDESSSAGERTSGEKRKTTSDAASSSAKRRRSGR